MYCECTLIGVRSTVLWYVLYAYCVMSSVLQNAPCTSKCVKDAFPWASSKCVKDQDALKVKNEQTPMSHIQGRIIQPESSCIVYYTYYIILRIILCIIFTYDFKTIRPKSNSIIHNTQYNTYYGLIRIMYCHTLHTSCAVFVCATTSGVLAS
jgi:hypothetical protein